MVNVFRMKWYADGDMPTNKYINVDISFGRLFTNIKFDMPMPMCWHADRWM